MENEILVSVICTTYNQEDYIRDALESFLMQKTNFNYEIIVHDDASTDKTAEIIHKYEKKFPEIIKPIYQINNQYSQGIKITPQFILPKARGKYLAICEGDDYWTDPLKLQKQVDALEKRPDINMCAHAAFVVDAKTKKVIRNISPYKQETIATVEDVIMGGGGFFATNSLMYRKQLEYNQLPFWQFLRLDYTLQISGALKNGILYLPDVMSAYRWMAKGSWTIKMTTDKEMHDQFYRKWNEMFDILDRDTKYNYSEIITRKKLIDQFYLLCDEQKYLKALSFKYWKIYKYIGNILVFKIFAKGLIYKYLKNKGRK